MCWESINNKQKIILQQLLRANEEPSVYIIGGLGQNGLETSTYEIYIYSPVKYEGLFRTV